MQLTFTKRTYLCFLCYCLVLVLLFHTLRNLTPIYYVAYGGIVAAILISAYSINKIKIQNKLLFISYSLFVMYTFWLACWSTVYNPDVSVFTSFSRLFFITLLPLILLPIKLSNVEVDRILYLFIFAVLLASLSYPYQSIYGPVEWFNDSAVRGGIDRFSSSLGAITVYGMSAGIVLYITFIQPISSFSKIFITLILLMGVFFSLQKASFINILLAVFFITFYLRRIDLLKFIFAVIFIGLIIYYYALFNQEQPLSVYFQTFVVNTVNINLFDNPSIRHTQSIDDTMITSRLIGLHVTSIIEEHGLFLVSVLGIGTTGGGGAMGVDAYQAHNALWTLYLMGGVPYLLIFLLLFFLLQYNLYIINTSQSKLFLVINVIFFANLFASSAAAYHPVSSFCFWISVSVVINHKVKSRILT